MTTNPLNCGFFYGLYNSLIERQVCHSSKQPVLMSTVGEKAIDEGDDITDDCGAVEVFGVVTYALNDMRTCEFDDLIV